ncbi:MAG: molybdenum cofactor carrier [Rhodothermaceae bacterium]|nr:molybdenum cofactor carrier [Rhodothermaceae bacterium]MYB91185.1 molybdenum cofactor carrier [Rhodothermaceae bacterium]MYD66746.1 molybdenum cofactor carrier [Rhodothermaceae bacterium]MYG43986.1 molybdenum cofactor carrier [Rhodothermaceae bacterium]MYJ08328.1 molybdenum cofactor carrier [Rhodothermaceae bacterium]
MSDSKFTIISGGQTGVDRAALDVAIKWGLPYKGWCPAGRWAEDGKIPGRYLLRVTPESNPAQRTVWNVQESDGVLILGGIEDSEGTQLARKTAEELHQPVLHAELGDPVELVIQWVRALESGIVNVAGPRESEHPGIYEGAFEFLDRVVQGYLAAERNTS